jgi:hypothetical protein
MLFATCSSLVGCVGGYVRGGGCPLSYSVYESFSPISRSLRSVLFDFERLRVTACGILCELFKLDFEANFFSLFFLLQL